MSEGQWDLCHAPLRATEEGYLVTPQKGFGGTSILDLSAYPNSGKPIVSPPPLLGEPSYRESPSRFDVLLKGNPH